MSTIFEKIQQEWQAIKTHGFFSLFLKPQFNWETVISSIEKLSQQYPGGILSALFHISGVSIPLSLSVNLQNRQQGNWLRKIKSGEIIASHCMTETSVGTDTFLMKTLAKREGDNWLISGEKNYICNAPIADVGLLYTNTEGYEINTPYNISCFLLDMNLEGVNVGAPYSKLGLQTLPMSQIIFNNVAVSNDYLIYNNTLGWNLIHMSTTFERLLIPIAFIGFMKKMYESISSKHKSEAYRQIIICESLLRSIIGQINIFEWNRKYIKLGCLFKWQLSESYIFVAKLTSDEQCYRDALSSWIYSGTNDVLKNMLNKLL